MKKTRLFTLFLVAGKLCLLSSHGEAPRLTGLSLGVGDWISVSDGDWKTREDYGTFPGAGIYFFGWGWNGSLSIPVKTAFKRIRHQTRYALGNGEISLGKRLGMWTPRMALRVPLYSWSVDDALENELFIGAGTVDFALGAGGKLPRRFLPKRVDVQFDLEASTALTRGLADYGSSHALGVVQVTYAFDSRWKAGVNTLFLGDHWIWIPDFWDQEGETKFTVMPGVVAGVRMFKSTYVDIKAGMSVYEYRQLTEARYPYRPQAAYQFGLSIFQGL